MSDAIEALKQKKAEEQACYERARARWICRYGSERLRMAKKQGYNHNGLYVRERAARERPGYVVDLQKHAEMKDIENPTLEHMQAAKEEKARLVWLTALALDMKPDCDDYEPEPGPALVIEGFLGKWTLVKVL